MMAMRTLIVVGLLTVALAYMIIDRQTMLNSSRVVTLKVVPVDPNDMFRGEYVVLSYDVSRLDVSKLEGDDKFDYQDKVHVTLVPDGATWKAAAIARSKPASTPGGVSINGTVTSISSGPATGPDGQPQTAPAPQIVSVDYGIESYFVPQGTGKEIEAEARKGDLMVDVAVDDKGRGAIKAIRRPSGTIYVEGIF